ncbi:hypothetical protein AAG570_006874 [Ranatra chinensis]|uniref:Major facilitator superfamily (MFS) profile domain-containing protein n=1 Tax=Ranatra chinensis TaxID=642074 RepID=A0ABD0Z7Z5_9HEMI
MTQSLLLFALGMLITVPTIVIGALHKAKEGLSLNDQQASWFAGLLLIFQPVGSILSGMLQEPMGRKKCMILVNLPQLAGWLLVYYAQSVETLFLAAICMGFSVGFKEAPTLSYVGEISQPHLRGTLASFTSVYVSVGNVFMFLLGSVTDWRTTAAISTVVPVVTAIAISQMPESPVWLLMKERDEEALKSLCWLRGWVTPDKVESEFCLMKKHARNKVEESSTYLPLPLNAGSEEVEAETPARGRKSLVENLKELMKPSFVKPLRLVVVYFLFMHCASTFGSRPYLVHVLSRLNVPIRPHLVTVMAGVMQTCGSLVCMGLARKVGRRKLSMISMAMCSSITVSLGLYSLLQERAGIEASWVPLILIVFLFFSTYVGIGVIPWTLLAEVFPSRHRGLGGGISAAMYYVWFFVVSKTFLDLERWLQLFGVYFFYGMLGMCGIVFLYFFLPETEGKRLDEVEHFFATKRTDKRRAPHII